MCLGMSIVDVVIRHHQIVNPNFEIIASSHKLSVFFEEKLKTNKGKRKHTLRLLQCAGYLEVPVPGLTFPPWFLDLCECSSIDVYSSFDKTNKIFEPYWFWGSKLYSITAADINTWSANT